MNYSEACLQLGLSSSEELSDAGLKKAFKKAALKHHPDKNLTNPEQAKETFQKISTAYEFLNQCVARNQTGPNQPRFATSDNPLFEGDGHDDYMQGGGMQGYYYDDDEDEEEEYVHVSDVLFEMFFAKMAFGGGGGAFFVDPSAFGAGPSRGYHHHHHHTPHRGYEEYGYDYDDAHDYYDDDDDDHDARFEEMFNAYAEQERRKEEAREARRQREKEHTQYMADRARQAELEGRDFFESWNVKQLMGECNRRGISVRGKQQKDIIEALIRDEAKKRLRTQLKQEAPLLDEWAEVIHMKKNAEMNGLKVRAIDYYGDLGKYVVEWDMNAKKKKAKGHTRESKTARVKPENLRLWGTGEPLQHNNGDVSSDKENNKQKQQAEQQQQGDKKKGKKSNNTDHNSKKQATKATVPEVPKTKCCAICYKEHDLEQADDDNKAKAFTILPCAHIFCNDCCGGSYLPDQSSDVEIRSCRVCHKPDPGVQALMSLPYVADLLDAPQALVDLLYKEYSWIVTCESVEALEQQQEREVAALDLQKAKSLKEQKDALHNKANNGKMNKDKKGKLVKQIQADVEAEFGPKRKDLQRKHEQQWRSVAKKEESLKELHEQRDAATKEATSAISKHYRRASIKVHPDRHGDKFQKEFDALINAKDTLCEVELRHSYMEQMLQIVCTVGTHWVSSSHKAWVDKHQPDMAEQNPTTTKKSDAPGNQAPLQIEGGLVYSHPRKPSVAVLNAKERRVRVTLRIPCSSYEFFTYATAVHIMGERADVYNEEFEEEFHKTVYRDAFNAKVDGEIEVDMVLPDEGMWDLRWNFTLEMEPDAFRDSERSAETTVDLVSPKYKSNMKLMKSFESVAVRRAFEIHSALRKLTNATGNHADIESRHNTLQEVTLKAKHTLFHLEKSMASVGANTSATGTPLAQLRSALAATRPYKEDLDKAMALHEKKVAYKNFKQVVYDILENGNGGEWVALVTEETLKDEMKGDPNRLYQLLMEGKKAYNLDLVDAATLFVASDRKDLFSPKQLKALLERSEAAEIRAGEEARRIMIENEKKESAENQRRSLQQRADEMDCKRGDLVQIIGLKSEPALNGRLATYLAPSWASNERYNVVLDEGREIALRQHNFRKYDGVSVVNYGAAPARKQESWACKTCTYLHMGAQVEKLSQCSICGTPRNGESKVPEEAANQLQSKEAAGHPKLAEAKTKDKASTSRPSPPQATNPPVTISKKQPSEENLPPNRTGNDPPKQTRAPPKPASEKAKTDTSTMTKSGLAAQRVPTSNVNAVGAQLPLQMPAVSAIPINAASHKGSAKQTQSARSGYASQKSTASKNPMTSAKIQNSQAPSSAVPTTGINIAEYLNSPARPRPQPLNTKKQRQTPTESKFETTPTPAAASGRTPPRENVSSNGSSANAAHEGTELVSKSPVAPSHKVTPLRTEQEIPRCKYGKKCKFLKKGLVCRFRHTAEETAAVKGASGDAPSRTKKAAPKKRTPATPATVVQSSNTNQAFLPTDDNPASKIEMTILVDNKAAGFVLGRNHIHLKEIERKTGATLKSSKKGAQDNMCHIKIRGPSQGVIEQAAALVHGRVDEFEKRQTPAKGGNSKAKPADITPTENSSISTVPSIINGSIQQRQVVQTPPKLAVDHEATQNLLAFLESHSSALKCAPDAFLLWLQKQDIESMSELCEAIEDEYFVKELLHAGLKRFKMVAFLRSLKTMLEN